VATLRAAYDKWWDEVQALLVNEGVTGPKINPMKELYWKQFGGGPDEAMRKRMEAGSDGEAKDARKPKRAAKRHK